MRALDSDCAEATRIQCALGSGCRLADADCALVFGCSGFQGRPDHKACFQRLTFELRRDQQQNARPAGRKMRTPGLRAWRFDVGPRLERGVRPRLPT